MTTTVGNVAVMTSSHKTNWAVTFFHEGEGRFPGTMVSFNSEHKVGRMELIPDGLCSQEYGTTFLDDASETLHSLVQNFHVTKAVMPLIDRLLEEYGEHLTPYVVGVLNETPVEAVS